jgi:hypothetical protein
MNKRGNFVNLDSVIHGEALFAKESFYHPSSEGGSVIPQKRLVLNSRFPVFEPGLSSW